MNRVPIAGFILRRLGSAFVDRESRADRQRTARALHSLANRGSALGFFPEGTFDQVAGAQSRFISARSRRGARESARRADRDLWRTLHKLPSQALLPRARPAARADLRRRDACRRRDPTARALMIATRRAMLAHLDEPDLAPEPAYIPE